MDHWTERAANRLKPFAKPGILLSMPIFIFTYGWGLKLLLQQLPMWTIPIIGLIHSAMWIGIALLHDLRLEQAQKRFGQSVPPDTE